MKIDGAVSGNNFPIQTSGIGQGSREQKPVVTGQENQVSVTKDKQLSEEQVIKAVEKANKSFEPFDRKFEISGL